MLFHSVHYANPVAAWFGSHVGTFIMLSLIIAIIVSVYVTTKLFNMIAAASFALFAHKPNVSAKMMFITFLLIVIIQLVIAYKLIF